MNLKKYYAYLNNGSFEYLGEFPCYSEAYDYTDYELNLNFVWIFKEEKLRELKDQIEIVLHEKNEDRR